MPRFQLPPTSTPGAPPTPPRAPALRALALALPALGLAAPASAAGDSLEIFPELPVTVLLIVIFTLLVWPANRLVWAPVLKVIDERRERIEGARTRAAELGGEADVVLARYEEAVGRARAGAESTRREALDKVRRESSEVGSLARGQAEEEVARARSEVASALEQARAELRGQAEALAREAATQVLGRPLS